MADIRLRKGWMVGDGRDRRQAGPTGGTAVLEVTPTLLVPLTEFDWSYARSGGPGGQNVNKVESKAVLRWNLAASPSVPADVKARLTAAHPAHTTTDGEFLVTSQRYRDQERNREDCLRKLADMLLRAAVRPTVRKKTKPSKASNRRRLEAKKANSQRRADRRVDD
jgi:ribosome-associated protein